MSARILRLVLAGAFLATVLLSGCAGGSVLSNVSLSPAVISPDGVSNHGTAALNYQLNQRADVTVSFVGPDGQQHVIRDARTRDPGQYAVSVDGTYNGRVLPDGPYTWSIVVTDPQTRKTLASQQAKLTIKGADTVPPQIGEAAVFPNPFQPNGNLSTDTSTFTYTLSKPATVTIWAVGPTGDPNAKRYDVLYQTQQQVGPNQALWTGQIGPERYVPDGQYQWTIEATDAAGNVTTQTGTVGVTDSGIADGKIENVTATEVDRPDGRYIQVQVRMYNSGYAVLNGDRQPGAPQSGFTYGSLSATYLMPPPFGPGWSEQAAGRAGTYTVGVSYFERDSQPNLVPLPFRWSIGDPLQPKQSRVITGYIKIPSDYHGQVSIYAGIVHEGQGILSGQFQIPAGNRLNLP